MAAAVNAQVSYAFCVVVAVFALLTSVAEVRSAVAERVAAPTGSAGRLNVIDEGPRASTLTPVLLVHSFAGSAEQWDAQIAHLRSTRRVVAIDLRGHGKSDAPANAAGYNVAALASDIGALADQFGIKHFILVGHGVGAVAALAYAERHPLRVDRLISIGRPNRLRYSMRARYRCAAKRTVEP
jgi:pimeloyl-ACP methyl ester carboxylesterase